MIVFRQIITHSRTGFELPLPSEPQSRLRDDGHGEAAGEAAKAAGRCHFNEGPQPRCAAHSRLPSANEGPRKNAFVVSYSNQENKRNITTDFENVRKQVIGFKKMRDGDLITEGEFEAKKKQLLGLASSF